MTECNKQRAGRLFMRYRHNLAGYIAANVRDFSLSEEILQEVCAAVIELSERMPKDESAFVPWAINVARFRTLKCIKKANRMQYCDPELMVQLADDSIALAQDSSPSAQAEAARACLQQLRSDKRELMEMRYGEISRTASQIASQLNLTVTALNSLLHRVRIKLRNCVRIRLAQEDQL